MNRTNFPGPRRSLWWLIAILAAITFVFPALAAPKKLLVVTVTKGFRHSSIPTAEKVLGELAEKSGAFTVEYVRTDDEMAQKMTAEALKAYDGVIFANTTGELPLPDKEAFMEWLKSGKAFIGMHSAADTFHPFPPYREMLGAEFETHHSQAQVDCINQDPSNPACRRLGPTFQVKDEIYLMKNFERSKVHGLLGLDKHPADNSKEGNAQTPGDYPIAWVKEYGKGRVFYTSLGHREDVWDPNTPETFKRENPKSVAEAYQQHILGGIKWALGLEDGSGKSPASARKALKAGVEAQ